MKRTRFQSMMALLLILCMLLSICSVLTACGKDDEEECKHTSTSIVGAKAATCGAVGYTGDTKCNDCGHITKGTEIAKLSHSWDSGKVTKEPTCSVTGITTYTCTACKTTKVDAIPTVAHDSKYHDDGAGQHIITCKTCTVNEKGAHTPKDAGMSFSATCTEPAYKLLTCKDCNASYKEYSTTELALDHNFSEWVLVESTCIEAGSRTQHCQNPGCQEKNILAIPVATSHNMEFVGYQNDQAPDCIHDAVALYACKDCNEPDSKDVSKTGVHKYEAVTDSLKVCAVCHDEISSISAKDTTVAQIPTTIATDKALEVETQKAAIQLPSDVLSQITGGADLSISADTVDDDNKNAAIESVTDEAKKEALQNAPIYDFTITVDGNNFSDNFSTKVAITLFYGFEVDDAEGIVIYYLAENGDIEEIREVVYNEETGEVTFFVEHFSFYAVAYEETQEMRCKRGNHNYLPTGNTQTATCYRFGYTEYACSGCGRVTIDDIAERLPHAFDYNNVIKAEPTCESPAWSYVKCSNTGCFEINNIELAGATGHSMDHAASCTEASICTKCHKVLATKLGHKWGDWSTTQAPTETSEGKRTHSCLRCGITETETLATLGTVEAIKYDSYTDLINLVLDDLLGLEGGKIEFEATVDGEKVTLTVYTQKTANGYRMSLEGYADGVDFEFYYNNGIFVVINGDNIAYASELDNLIPIAIDVYTEILEMMYAQLDAYAVEYLSILKEYVASFKTAYGETVNDIFEAAGLDYTVNDIDAIVDSVETLYAYLSLKLGLDPSLNMKGEVKLPTAKDVTTVLSLFMNSSEAGGITTYTFTQQPIYDLINGIVDFINAHKDETLAQFVYFIIGDAAKEYNASLTSFDAIVDFIAQKLPGSFTVADAIDLYVEFATENGLLSLEELYAIIDSALAAQLQGASIADMIEQMSTMTLDQLMQNISGSEQANMADLYAMIKASAAELTFGELEYQRMTVADIAAMLGSYAEMIDLDLNVSIAVDANGKLVSFVVNQALEVTMGDDIRKIDSISLSITNDASATVEFPAALDAAMPDVEYTYDAAGNVIITGLNPDAHYNFSVMGNGSVDFDDVLVYDAQISTELGKPVYVLKEAYWNETDHIDSFMSVDGKYYYEAYAGYCNVITPNATYSFNEIASAIASRINALDDSDKIGTLIGTETPVYAVTLLDGASTIAIAYKDGDTWMISTQYGSSYSDSYDGGYGGGYGEVVDKTEPYAVNKEPDYAYSGNKEFYAVAPMTVEDFVKTVKLGTIRTMSYAFDNHNDHRESYLVSFAGNNYDRLAVTVHYGNFGQTTTLAGIAVGADTLIFADYDYIRGYSIYTLDTEVAELPAHDLKNEYTTSIATYDASGKIKFITATRVYLYDKAPSYFFKVADGVYTSINSDYFFDSMDPSSMDSIVLPDGNTLYILGRTMDNEYGYKYGYETVYGFASTTSGVYIQTAALYEGNTLVEVRYRGAAETDSVNLEALYNVNDYITVENGTYKISAELINKLNEVTANDGNMYAIAIEGIAAIGGYNVEFMYYVAGQANVPEMDLGDMIGGTSSDYDFWYQLFNQTEDGREYELIYNEDGSISLLYPFGHDIGELYFSSNVEFPADTILTYDEGMSDSTGLNIYSYTGSHNYYYSRSYVYQNGKYYDYGTYTNYDLSLVDQIDFKNIWTIRDTRYRYDMIGAAEAGIPDGTPVYETEIMFNYYDTQYYRYEDQRPVITLYTFYMNGIMYVAVEAQQTGESLLQFERFMPIDEYINSLVFEVDAKSAHSPSTAYYKGRETQIYSSYVYIYETDENGKKLDNCQYTLWASYIKQGASTKYITNWAYLANVLQLGSEATNMDTVGKDRYEDSNRYYNGVFTIVSFNWEEASTYTALFVKLAGKFYRYDTNHYYSYLNSYLYERIPEWEFNNMSIDKVWYYVVEDHETYEDTYYTKFIPSDFGFTPAGDVVDPATIKGYLEERTLLGYTANGDAMYEEVYVIETEDSAEWTVETQADGTVFHHKNGAGYLQVDQNGTKYYVKARKVDMADGSTQIYCFIRPGCLTASEAKQYSKELFDQYVKVDGSMITFTEAFFEIAQNSNRNEFHFEFYVNGLGYKNFDYYQLEALFMMR